MNITFLIGNGFDLNLGLKTLFSHFVKEYKSTPTKDEDIARFKKHISENEELWSNAEFEFGQYSGELKKGEAAILSKCQKDFCEKLAIYLKTQEEIIDFQENSQKVVSAFSNLDYITTKFPTQEREILDNVYKTYINQNIYFRFINYNYTTTLDECVKIVLENGSIFKSHKYQGTFFKHTIFEPIVHVHGTVEKEMVFAVNDETQIANLDVFDCDYGNIYKNLVIKKNANNSYGENTDTKVWNIIKESHIIYVYGMSIGDTDKLWWERICQWLSERSDRHLIVHNYKMPEKGVLPVDYQIAEQEYKTYITTKSDLSIEHQKTIQNRIHITNHNIFEDIKEIACEDTLEYIGIDFSKDKHSASN